MPRLVAPALLCAALTVAVGLDAGQPARRGLAIDALVDIKHPSNPVWSRDGRHVAFTWERAGVSNLYVVPADGTAAPSAITSDGRPVSNVTWSAEPSRPLYFVQGGTLMRASAQQAPEPANLPGRSHTFSPDGSAVAYLVGGPAGGGRGGRGGRGRGGDPSPPQPSAPGAPTAIHVRMLSSGADRVVATFAGAVNGLAWTPDAARLTFTSGGAGGQTIRHEQTPEYSGPKIIYTITQNVPGEPADAYVVPVSGGMPATYSTGAGGGRGGRGGGARWLGASRLVAERRSPDFKRRSVVVVDTATGRETTLHEDVKTTFWSMVGGAGPTSLPSPDGKWIAFLSDRDGWDHLYVAAPGGRPVQVTKGEFEAWRPAWSPDGTQLAFDSNEGTNPGARHIYVANIRPDGTSTIRRITSGRGTNIQPIWSPDGRRVVYQHTDPQNSADLYVVDAVAPGAAPVRLTSSMPATIDKTTLVEPELVQYPGPDGKPVPAYLFVPKTLDRSRRHPAIVWIHGDGVNQNYDGWHVQRNYAVYYSFHQYLLQQGYVVIAPDYRGSIGYGSAWREGVYMDVGGKDFRDAAVAASFLKTLPYVDADRLGVWGLSYGGFFTLLAMTEYPTMYRAGVNVAGVVDYAMYYEDPYHGAWTESRIGRPDQHPDVYRQASPISHIDKLARPLLVLHGTADVNVPYLHSVRLVDEALKHGKGELLEFMTYPGELHYFTREHVLRDAWSRVDRFFAKHLRPGS